jgi:hypothetical protein
MNRLSLIPRDDLTRRLLCEVLAKMVLFDLEQQQSGTSDDPDADPTLRVIHTTKPVAEAQANGKHTTC